MSASTTDTPAAPTAPTPPYSLRALLAYFLRLGTTGFGGPVALVGFMHRDLVEDRKWFQEAEYKEGLTLAQLAPGPLAAQLSIYLGYVHHGVLGATLTGGAFVLPSFLMVVALGWAYVRFGGLPWMQAVFYGVGAAVIGIICNSAYKLTKRTLGTPKKNPVLWAVFLAVGVATAVLEREIVWFFLGAGVLVWLVRAPPRFLGGKGPPTATLLSLPPLTLAIAAGATGEAVRWPLLGKIALYFGKAGAFVFGSGLAIVPFLYGGVVKENHWLDDRQFLDAVAVAMITPGPVVITVGFIGYLIAGLPGACVAALATFLPCWAFTVVPAPYFRKYGKRPGIAAFVDGVTAAAIGAICGSVVVLGRRSIVDVPTALIACASLGVLMRFKRIPEPLIVLAAAGIGLAIFPLLHRM
jgi:chromate transporter